MLIAVTSSIAKPMNENLEIFLSKEDIFPGMIPRESVAKISKIFTCHKDIVAKKVAMVKETKLNEILEKLRSFFSKGGLDELSNNR